MYHCGLRGSNPELAWAAWHRSKLVEVACLHGEDGMLSFEV
jgi:hypothetical protein